MKKKKKDRINWVQSEWCKLRENLGMSTSPLTSYVAVRLIFPYSPDRIL